MKLVETWKKFLEELTELENIDMSSFEMKENLNQDIWENELLKTEIGDRLYEIAKDFFDSLEINWVEIEDIILTGSLANYNWSGYSDIDLHIIIDYKKIDENIELVKDYLNSVRMRWNDTHDIKIKGFEVEIYMQDAAEEHISTGIYSIVKDEWVRKPSREELKIDWSTVEKKATSLMKEIDSIYELFNNNSFKEALHAAERLKEKIRKFRKAGLETGGQYSAENLTFKALRRNEYLRKLSSLRITAYDKMMSLNGEQN